jgi:hypothetical protein
MTADAQWCSQCFALPAPAPSTSGPATSPSGGFRPAAAATAAQTPAVTRTTRWGKTQTTFGPVGRVVATVATLLPLAVMTVGGFVDMFAWGGALIYLVAIVPWARRETWQAGRIAVR